jgi:hypothetical protein
MCNYLVYCALAVVRNQQNNLIQPYCLHFCFCCCCLDGSGLYGIWFQQFAFNVVLFNKLVQLSVIQLCLCGVCECVCVSVCVCGRVATYTLGLNVVNHVCCLRCRACCDEKAVCLSVCLSVCPSINYSMFVVSGVLQ